MANTDFNAVLTAATVVRSSLLTALEKRGIYVIAAGETHTSLTPGNVQVLFVGGRSFLYDATDSTTANDGVTCCVTADGKRFKADNYAGSQKRIWEVKSKTLTAPPGSPTIGDQYIVAASATGAWAGKDNYIAVYSARGWVFIVPNPYDIALNDADTSCYYYNLGGTWSSGFPFTQTADGSLSLKKLKYFPLGVSVINQTTNAPPGSPADGDAYVIGPSPTGAWSGLARQVAIYEVSAWAYYVPYDGSEVFDKNSGAQITYRSGTATWNSPSGYAFVLPLSALLATSTCSTTAGNAYNFATGGSGPTAAQGNPFSGLSFSYAAKKATAWIEIEVNIGSVFESSSGNVLTLSVFIDSAANAADWKLLTISSLGSTPGQPYGSIKFYVQPGDTSSHTYTIRGSTSAFSNHTITLGRAFAVLREIS